MSARYVTHWSPLAQLCNKLNDWLLATEAPGSLYPHAGVCANCGRGRDDLFWHAEHGKFYCVDVFRCEARFEILDTRRSDSPAHELEGLVS